MTRVGGICLKLLHTNSSGLQDSPYSVGHGELGGPSSPVGIVLVLFSVFQLAVEGGTLCP
jgi:hypothetical protein